MSNIRLITTLRARHRQLGLTQQQLACRMNVTRITVVRGERRDRRLDVLELSKWLRALGMWLVDVEAMLAGKGR